MLPDPGLYAFLPNLGATEMMVVMLIAVLLFGKRLPEVGRSLGKGIVEFKKGLGGLTEDLDLTSLTSSSSSVSPYRYDDSSRSSASSYSSASSSSSTSSSYYSDAAVPKLEPPAASPEGPTD